MVVGTIRRWERISNYGLMEAEAHTSARKWTITDTGTGNCRPFAFVHRGLPARLSKAELGYL